MRANLLLGPAVFPCPYRRIRGERSFLPAYTCGPVYPGPPTFPLNPTRAWWTYDGIAIFLSTTSITGNAPQELKNRKRKALEIWVYDRSSVFDLERKEELIRLGERVVVENKDRIVRWLTRRWPFWA